MSLLDKIRNKPVTLLILAIISVVSFLYSFCTRRKKQIDFDMKANEIMTVPYNTDDIKILFRNKEVENIISTRIILWNSGNEIINHDDIVRQIGISLEDDTKMLSMDILKCKNCDLDTNQIRIDDNYNITFDFLEPKNQIEIQVLYTGNKNAINVRGKIKGGTIKKQDKDKISKYSNVLCAICILIYLFDDGLDYMTKLITFLLLLISAFLILVFNNVIKDFWNGRR